MPLHPILNYRILVPPKDKHEVRDTAEVVYQIPCQDCPKIYTGETRRRYVAQEKEHKRDMTWRSSSPDPEKKDSLTEVHPSALTDHVAQTNYTINWGSVKPGSLKGSMS